MYLRRLFLGAGAMALALVFMSQTQKPVVKKTGGTGGGLTASIARGKTVYESICLACHQVDGLGVQNMNPPLAKTKWVLGDKTKLIQIVLKGLPGGSIDIDGDTFHNPMPPQAANLSDQQIADVLTYVRNNFGNKASMVTAVMVKTVRAQTK
jgi:mono/diheme cytochrome c family protein